MKYSYKFKRQCVELYRQGKWPETPKDITEKGTVNSFAQISSDILAEV